MSLRGNVKLYYVIEYNTFILFVEFFFYFDRFLILSTLEFVSIKILLVSLYKDLCYLILKINIHSNKNFSFLLLLIGFPNFDRINITK